MTPTRSGARHLFSAVLLFAALAGAAPGNCGLRIADCGLGGTRTVSTGQGRKSAFRQSAIRNPQSAIAGLAFRDLAGQRYTDRDLRAAPASLFLFLSTECPICHKYTSRIVGLAGQLRSRGVLLFGVSSDDDENAEALARYAKERGYTFPLVKDPGGALAERLGARFTPEAVLMDGTGRIRYRGRIDDSPNTEQVRTHDLQEALEAVLAGKPVARAEVPAFGCAIRRTTNDKRRTTNDQRPTMRVAASRSALPPASLVVGRSSLVTYARDVAPILQANCQSCHRAGEVAPFALSSYEQARKWAAAIKETTGRRLMPPWRATPGYGEFRNARGLTEAQIATLARWADAGTPQGDLKELPPPRKFEDGWALGEPDLVLAPAEEYSLAADGNDVYRCFVLPTHLAENRYVAAIEVRPGNRAVVHHVLAHLDSTGKSEKLDAADPGPGYTVFGGVGFPSEGILGAWAPGITPNRLPDGVGHPFPAGSRIVMQVHYHKSGKPGTDRTRLGVYFARGVVDQRLQIGRIRNRDLQIPAGAEQHEVRAEMTVPRDIHAIWVAPHMHLLGRDVKLTATLPDGTTKPMVWIKDWDFNWQEIYTFQAPIALPAGTRVEMVGHYDNSFSNPRNPNRPPQAVGWGEQTTDEMFIAFLGHTVDGEHLANAAPANPQKGQQAAR